MTYEAHKEYLAKMYEEYQRQEEENIKKGKKGFVSTISGLSAQASGINGVVEIREMDDNSNTPESEKDYESVDSRILLAEGKGHEEGMVDGVSVGVHDLLVDIKAEKVEATEVKLDDIETLGVSENGALVEVDSLLDSVYCAAAKKLRGSVDEHNAPPLITLDDDKDSIPHSNFLFGKVAGSMEDKLLPDVSTAEPLVLPSTQSRVHTSASDELGLLAHMTGRSELGSLPSILENDEFELQAATEGISPVTGSENEASSKSPEVTEGTDGAEIERNSSIFKTCSAADTTSNTSDTEGSHNGRDKDARKIQTTATTQVGLITYHRVHSLQWNHQYNPTEKGTFSNVLKKQKFTEFIRLKMPAKLCQREIEQQTIMNTCSVEVEEWKQGGRMFAIVRMPFVNSFISSDP